MPRKKTQPNDLSSEIKPVDSNTGAQLPNTKFWRIATAIALILGIIAAVFSILSDSGVKNTLRNNVTPTPQQTPIPTITQGNIGILIADFKNDSQNVSYDAAGSIADALNQYFKQNNLQVEIVRISDEIKRGDNQKALDIAQQRKAALVIWGYYDDGGMYPRILTVENEKIDYPITSPEDKLVNLSNPPDDFTFYVNKELPNQMKYLALFTIAQILERSRGQEDALRLYDQVIVLGNSLESEQVKQNNANVYLAKARLYHYYFNDIELQKQNLSLAQGLIEKIPSDSTEFYSALNRLGNIHADLGEYEIAINYYQKAISIKVANPTAHYNLALAYSDFGNVDEARKEYEETIKYDQTYTPAYNNLAIIVAETENKTAAIKILSDALQIAPRFDVARGNRANYYMDIKRFDLALADLEILVTKFPNSTKLLMNRGLARNLLGQFDAAIEDYSKVLGMHEDYTQAYLNRGGAYSEQGNYILAISDFQSAIDLSPSNPDGYHNLGTTLAVQGLYDEAIVQFTKAIEADPSFYPAYANRGVAYRNIGNHSAAMNDYNKALTIYDDPFTYSNRGALKGMTGDNPGAIEDFTTAIELENNPDYYINRALAYESYGKPDLAIKDLEDGLELNPPNPQVYKDEIARIKHDAYGFPYLEDVQTVAVILVSLVIMLLIFLRLKSKKKFRWRR